MEKVINTTNPAIEIVYHSLNEKNRVDYMENIKVTKSIE